MAYTGRFCLKGVPFWGFMSMKWSGKFVILVCQRSNRCILWLWTSRENVKFCDFFIFKESLKTVNLQQLLKGINNSKLGMWKWYHPSITRIRKGTLFLSKIVYEKGKALDLGAEPPRIKLCLVPPGFFLPGSIIWRSLIATTLNWVNTVIADSVGISRSL